MHAPEQRYHHCLNTRAKMSFGWTLASISLYLGGPENLHGKSPPRTWPYSVPWSRGLTVMCSRLGICTWNWRSQGPRTWSLLTCALKSSLLEGLLRTHMAITVSSDTLTSGKIFSNLQSVDGAEMTMVRDCRQGLRMFFRMEGKYKSSTRTFKLLSCLLSPWPSWSRRWRSKTLALLSSSLHLSQMQGIPVQARSAAQRISSCNLKVIVWKKAQGDLVSPREVQCRKLELHQRTKTSESWRPWSLRRGECENGRHLTNVDQIWHYETNFIHMLSNDLKEESHLAASQT